MTDGRRPVLSERSARVEGPPRLLVKTLSITFLTVALLLVIVFIVVTLSVRGQVRQSVAANLESSQRMFAALETRRQREMQMQAASLAENPTLKAALDTYQLESRGSRAESVRPDLLETIDRELKKVAAVSESDALILVDTRQNTIAAAGRVADRWPRGRPVTFLATQDGNSFDGIARATGAVFRVVAVPVRLDDGSTIGTFYVATSLDQAYAEELARVAGTRIAIVSDALVVAARHERTSAAPLRTGIVVGSRTSLKMVETTAGYRVSPDITFRSSYYVRKFYGATTWDNQVGFSVRRWW